MEGASILDSCQVKFQRVPSKSLNTGAGKKWVKLRRTDNKHIHKRMHRERSKKAKSRSKKEKENEHWGKLDDEWREWMLAGWKRRSMKEQYLERQARQKPGHRNRGEKDKSCGRFRKEGLKAVGTERKSVTKHLLCKARLATARQTCEWQSLVEGYCAQIL